MQMKFNLNWAKRNNYKIIRTYSDDGTSDNTVANAHVR